jgi:hypothetical protein
MASEAASPDEPSAASSIDPNAPWSYVKFETNIVSSEERRDGSDDSRTVVISFVPSSADLPAESTSDSRSFLRCSHGVLTNGI